MKDYKVIYLIVLFLILSFLSVYYMDRYLDNIQTRQESSDSF